MIRIRLSDSKIPLRISESTRRALDHEIRDLEDLLTEHAVKPTRAKQLRNFFSVSQRHPGLHRHIRRAYWTPDETCLVTVGMFADAIEWMIQCDAEDRRESREWRRNSAGAE